MEVQIKTNLKLFPWQRDVLTQVVKYGKGYIHVVKSKRQVGKSTMLTTLLLKTAIENKATNSICLCPTLEQARKIFKELIEVVQQTQIYRKHHEVQLYIMLKNGSKIFFKSAEQREALRGYTVTGIYVIDEAAYIPDDIFYDTLAWVNVSNAPVIICSTPRNKVGFFYKYYMLGTQNGNKILSYDWSQYDTSALLSKEKLEQYRKEVPLAKFKTEYLGEFLDNEGGVFGSYGDIISNNITPNLNCYMGIDWGSGVGQDETAVCVFNSDKQMVDLIHFSDKDETQTVNEIIRLIKFYQPLKVQVETNSIGQVFYGLLDKAIKAEGLSVMLVRFTTTNESKERLINNFQVAQQNKTVQILEDSCLLTEMDMYEMKTTSNGKRTYNAHSGYHDDCVIAMLLAFDCITKGNYILRYG